MFDRVLACPNLPTFPTVASQLLELTRDPDVALNDIAKLIKGDQGLASKVLKTVNSSFYGLAQPCRTIERALGYLGLKAIKSLVLGFSVARVTKSVDGQNGIDMADYWRRTICAASGARQIAVSTRACDPDEAFTAGLFQDMGMLACLVTIQKEYVKLLDTTEQQHGRLPEIEKQALGFTHAEIGSALAEKWRFSDAVVASVRFHHNPEDASSDQDLVKVVALGRLAAEVIATQQPAQALADLLVHANNWFGRDNTQVEALLDQISQAADELADILEQQIGDIPDAAQIMAMANEQLVQQQLQSQRESEQLERKAQKLEAQTVTDTLTGAANRKRFDSEIQDRFEQAQQKRKPLSVLFIDADKFKSVNDTHGHQAGDAVLVELSKRMRELVGALGTVCRYGGEEFAIILPNCSLLKAKRFAELIRRTIAGSPFDLHHVAGAPPTLSVTASIGVGVMVPGQTSCQKSATQLVQEADKAVYEAKGAGRNCVRVYGENVSNSASAAPGEVLPSAPVQPSTDGKAPSISLRILIIEDDPLAAKFLQTELARQVMVDVTWIATRTEALAQVGGSVLASTERPDLILCEMEFPDGHGIDVLKAVQSNPSLNSVRMIMLTRPCLPKEDSDAFTGNEHVISKEKIAADPDGWVRSVVERFADKVLAA